MKLLKASRLISLKTKVQGINSRILCELSHFRFSGQEVKKETFSESEALEIVEAGVFEVLKGAAKCKQDKLSRAALFKDLGFDSLDQVEIVVALEEKFNINVTGKPYNFKHKTRR